MEQLDTKKPPKSFSPLSIPSSAAPTAPASVVSITPVKSPQIHVTPGAQVSYNYRSTSTPAALEDVANGRVATTAAATSAQTVAGEIHVGQERKQLILCFDGTGNKFKGNAGDTNILKIFRMLDRSKGGKLCVLAW